MLWKLKSADQSQLADNASKIKQVLEGLNGKIPGMLKLEVGINFNHSPESVDVSMLIEFTDKNALNEYKNHPEHEKVKPVVMLLREERRVVDYEV